MNGAVRVVLVDFDAPGSGPIFLLVLSPPYEDGARQCKYISLDNSLGFAEVAFDKLTSSYDSAMGLGFQLPVKIYQLSNETYGPAMLSFSLNQATGLLFRKQY